MLSQGPQNINAFSKALNIQITTVLHGLRFNFGLKFYKLTWKPRLTPLNKSEILTFK